MPAKTLLLRPCRKLGSASRPTPTPPLKGRGYSIFSFPAKSPAMSEKPDYRDTVFLPKTDFPMKAGLASKEPAILARWQADDLYGQLRRARANRKRFILHDGPPYANG